MDKTMWKNTNAGMRGGASCSSDEAFVMKAERRGVVILSTNAVNLRG
jgi:hypothetical protein